MIYILDTDIEGTSLTDIFDEDIINDMIEYQCIYVPSHSLEKVLSKLYKIKNISGITQYDIYGNGIDYSDVVNVDYLKNINCEYGADLSVKWWICDNCFYLDHIEIDNGIDTIIIMLSDDECNRVKKLFNK